MDTAADISQTRLSQKPLNPDDLDEAVVRAVYKFLKADSDSLDYERSFARAKIRNVDTAAFEKEQGENEQAALEAERSRQLNALPVLETATAASLARMEKTQSRLNRQVERVEQAVRTVIVGWAGGETETG